eukprot:symbB.v1.2.008479.t1/scaffold534.1/size190675/10
MATLHQPLLAGSGRIASGKLEVCPQCGSPWCRCAPGSCRCKPLDLKPNSMPTGRFTLILQNLHSMDHSERQLVEEIASFVGGELTSFNEPLSTMEVEMSDAPEKLVNALCCAGLPAQLLKEVVLEAPDVAILQITGMTCAACVGVVENALKSVHGVKHAAVNLLMKRAEVKHRGVAVAELIEAVDDVGFDAELLQELKEASTQRNEKLKPNCSFSLVPVAITLPHPADFMITLIVKCIYSGVGIGLKGCKVDAEVSRSYVSFISSWFARFLFTANIQLGLQRCLTLMNWSTVKAEMPLESMPFPTCTRTNGRTWSS